MRFLRLLILLFAVTPSLLAEDAEWTVMVWMNGDNNLEKHVLKDWEELATVGSSDKVNVVVQLDQLSVRGTYRFRVPPNTGFPKLDPNDKLPERNMVDGAELREFVEDTRQKFKAKRYALIFSSHGDGWREIIFDPPAGSTPPPAEAADPPPPSVSTAAFLDPAPPTSIRLPAGVFGSPNRSISADDSNGFRDALYMRELADNLAAALGGERLDVIVFDACLMGMIEVAYGLRNVAKYFVASEELVSGAGMDYADVIGDLQKLPTQDGRAFAQRIVQLYRKLNGRDVRADPARTMAAFRLDFIGDLADAVSVLSAKMLVAPLPERRIIQRARDRIPVYASGFCRNDEDCFYHVDLKRFADLLRQNSREPAIRVQAEEVGRLLERARIEVYAGEERGCDYGSAGLAIYFPRTRDEYQFDPIQERAYRKANQHFPVEFVQTNKWTEFLHVYFLNAREEEVTP